jgi:hypothetical protein
LGAAAIVAAAVAFAIAQTNAMQVWSGRTTLTVGLAPTTGFLLLGSEPILEPIEQTRTIVTRLSDPAFKAEVLNHTPFAPETADLSRSLVSSSLRGIALGGDRDFAIELTAASSADTAAALQAFGSEIIKQNGAILDARLKMLQDRIEKSRARVAKIEESSDQLIDRIFSVFGNKDGQRPPIYTLNSNWNELQDHIQRDENLLKLAHPSVFHFKAGSSVQGPRRVAALRASLLAGFAVLVAMTILTIALNLRSRPARG